MQRVDIRISSPVTRLPPRLTVLLSLRILRVKTDRGEGGAGVISSAQISRSIR